MKLIKSFLFYVNSEDRIPGGEIYNFSIQLPPWLLQDIKQNTKIQVILQDFILRKSLYNVISSVNGVFSINETSGNNINNYTLTIPSGFYSVISLATYLSDKLTTSSQYYTYTITFNDIQAKYNIEVVAKSGQTLTSISFDFTSLISTNELMGFKKEIYNFTQSGIYLRLTSEKMVNLNGAEDRLYLRSSLVTNNIKRRTLTGQYDYTDVLASFSLSVDPLNIIYYIDNNELFSAFLNSKTLQPIISFQLTNEFNILLPFQQEYSFILRFKYFDEDNLLEDNNNTLNEIKELTKINLLSKTLKKK